MHIESGRVNSVCGETWDHLSFHVQCGGEQPGQVYLLIIVFSCALQEEKFGLVDGGTADGESSEDSSIPHSARTDAPRRPRKRQTSQMKETLQLSSSTSSLNSGMEDLAVPKLMPSYSSGEASPGLSRSPLDSISTDSRVEPTAPLFLTLTCRLQAVNSNRKPTVLQVDTLPTCFGELPHHSCLGETLSLCFTLESIILSVNFFFVFLVA